MNKPDDVSAVDLDNDPDLIVCRDNLRRMLDRHKVEFDWTDDLVSAIEELVDLKTALMLEAINGILASAIRNPSKP